MYKISGKYGRGFKKKGGADWGEDKIIRAVSTQRSDSPI